MIRQNISGKSKFLIFHIVTELNFSWNQNQTILEKSSKCCHNSVEKQEILSQWKKFRPTIYLVISCFHELSPMYCGKLSLCSEIHYLSNSISRKIQNSKVKNSNYFPPLFRGVSNSSALTIILCSYFKPLLFWIYAPLVKFTINKSNVSRKCFVFPKKPQFWLFSKLFGDFRFVNKK